MRYSYIIIGAILSTGCAPVSEVRQTHERVGQLASNQRSLHSDLTKLYNETQAELSGQRARVSALEQQVAAIREKTDRFEVRSSSDTLLFVPTNSSP